MKHVVILGGGFAGVAAALTLAKHTYHEEVAITIIDRNSFHAFNPSFYEVATSEEPQKNVAIPLKEIFGDRIRIIRSEITGFTIPTKTLQLGTEESITYDYLIIALGSEAAYFGIPGLQKYGLPLKSVHDAVVIKIAIKEKYHEKIKKNEMVKILIGGGGFSGTELAAELVNYRKHIASRHKKPEDCMEIGVIQGSDCLLKELDKKVCQIATKRLQHGAIQPYFGAHIKNVTAKTVETDDGKKYPYDILIWTGGVRANSIVGKSGLPLTPHGQLVVDDYLQVASFDHIFAAGDIAGFIDPLTQKGVPMVAQVAEEQGRIAGENVARSLAKKPLVKYTYRHFGYIVPLRGHFAVAAFKGFFISGFLGWILQQLVFLRYLFGILPLWKAMKRWNKFEMYLMR